MVGTLPQVLLRRCPDGQLQPLVEPQPSQM